MNYVHYGRRSRNTFRKNGPIIACEHNTRVASLKSKRLIGDIFGLLIDDGFILPDKALISVNPPGYVRIGISDSSHRSRYHWTMLHRYIWEKAYGKIDKDSVIHHKNGDFLDNRLINLACISRAEHGYLHRKHPDLSSSLWAEYYHKNADRLRENRNTCNRLRKKRNLECSTQ